MRERRRAAGRARPDGVQEPQRGRWRSCSCCGLAAFARRSARAPAAHAARSRRCTGACARLLRSPPRGRSFPDTSRCACARCASRARRRSATACFRRARARCVPCSSSEGGSRHAAGRDIGCGDARRQPGRAIGAAADHDAGGAGCVQCLARVVGRVDVAIDDDGDARPRSSLSRTAVQSARPLKNWQRVRPCTVMSCTPAASARRASSAALRLLVVPAEPHLERDRHARRRAPTASMSVSA